MPIKSLRIKSSLRRNRNLRRTNRVKYGGMNLFTDSVKGAMAEAKKSVIVTLTQKLDNDTFNDVVKALILKIAADCNTVTTIADGNIDAEVNNLKELILTKLEELMN
jgi:hypothetical protein